MNLSFLETDIDFCFLIKSLIFSNNKRLRPRTFRLNFSNENSALFLKFDYSSVRRQLCMNYWKISYDSLLNTRH